MYKIPASLLIYFSKTYPFTFFEFGFLAILSASTIALYAFKILPDFDKSEN
jgi:hypothetical protein